MAKVLYSVYQHAFVIELVIVLTLIIVLGLLLCHMQKQLTSEQVLQPIKLM